MFAVGAVLTGLAVLAVDAVATICTVLAGCAGVALVALRALFAVGAVLTGLTVLAVSAFYLSEVLSVTVVVRDNELASVVDLSLDDVAWLIFFRLLRLIGRVGWIFSLLFEGETYLYGVVIRSSERIVGFEKVSSKVISARVLEDDRLVCVDVPNRGIAHEIVGVRIGQNVIKRTDVFLVCIRGVLSNFADTVDMVAVFHQGVAFLFEASNGVLSRVRVKVPQNKDRQVRPLRALLQLGGERFGLRIPGLCRVSLTVLRV